MPDSSSPAGDAESSSGLMLAIRKFFDPDHGERSLRAQLEEAIDEHEGEKRRRKTVAPVICHWSSGRCCEICCTSPNTMRTT